MLAHVARFLPTPASISYSINFKTSTYWNPIIIIIFLQLTKPPQSASPYHICNALNAKPTVEFSSSRSTQYVNTTPSFVPFSSILPYPPLYSSSFTRIYQNTYWYTDSTSLYLLIKTSKTNPKTITILYTAEMEFWAYWIESCKQLNYL